MIVDKFCFAVLCGDVVSNTNNVIYESCGKA